jgi:hypothetical protein
VWLEVSVAGESQASAADGGMGEGKGMAQRRFRNYLLQPLLQIKLGLYCIILAILFAGALAVILYTNFAELVNSVVLMTDLEDEVQDLFLTYWQATRMWVYLVFCLYLVGTVCLSILYTHRLVGPTIAFRRHVRSLIDGRVNARTYLRKGDAFLEVAEELNKLSEKLEKSGGTS